MDRTIFFANRLIDNASCFFITCNNIRVTSISFVDNTASAISNKDIQIAFTFLYQFL